MTFDQAAWRAEFPVFENKCYINTCSYGALANSVRAAYDDYLDVRESEGSYWEHWVGKNEDLRLLTARLLNAKPSEIALTTSVTAGLNSLASAIDLAGARNKVVLSDLEFPTVGQIWLAAEARGAEVQIANEKGGRVPLENFEPLIDDNTAVVAITHVCYRNGAMNDIRGVVEMAHAHGALVVLDSYQAAGSLPIDPRALGVDACLGGNLKYLLGSAGSAFLWVREELLDRLKPATTGWFAQADIFAMDHRRNAPAADARKYEAGTPPVPNVHAAIAGLEIIDAIGVQNIRSHVQGLNEKLKAGIAARGFASPTPENPDHHGAMVTVKSVDMVELCTRLEADDIVPSYRDGYLRISPHFYNNEADIDRVLEGLDRHSELVVKV